METVIKTKKYWWISLIIGLLSVALGLLCLITPDVTLVALTIVFIVSFLMSGIMEISFVISNRDSIRDSIPGWSFQLAGGIIDLIFAFILLILPTTTTVIVLIYFIGLWIMFRGIWGIGISIDMQRMGIAGWGWLFTLAILSVLFSVLFIISPPFGATTIIAFASVAFLLYGLFRIYLSFTFKSLQDQ